MVHSNGVANGVVTARPLPEICYTLRRKVLAFLDEDLQDEVLRKVQHQVRISNTIIEDALRRYGREHLSISYNGGKDCLVLLVLLLACLPVVHPSASSDTSDAASPPLRFKALYIVSSKPFQEVEDFVAATSDEYHLDLDRYVTKMRPAIEEYLAKRPEVSAIFMGTRRTDPHADLLTHFDVTDKDWPQFMRVHPVIDWHYVEIWAFIRHLEIPFCELYNRGFTSLGGVTDTRPNPALAVANDATHFRPAYELRDDDEERLGRDR
ncbi:3'-phosphoadenosine 5'-phosphosulfate sulfotransferase [Neonectria magnoliae]|uniref:FAD synthase n=1 Tax=Neonectria magnoliae TaxID=2732573 RepID=A0ABR1I1H0_9HYPO